MGELMINEELAKRNKENYSFFDYVPGSTTRDYNANIIEVTTKILEAKGKVSEEAQTRLNNLLESYKVNYANWINKSNSNGANHVSSMISGPSNYNMRKHEKFIQRERTLMAEYENIKNIDDKIYSIVSGDKNIKSSDVNALEKLREKLANALEEHQSYKAYNIKARKEKTETMPGYVLSNSNGRIKAIKDRITRLERLETLETREITPSKEIESNGIKIVDNAEANRLQILFNGKPNVETRTILKKNGFRWCPTNSAWQRYRSEEAIKIAKEIVTGIVA